MKKETIEALINAFKTLEKALFELSQESRLFGESSTVKQARYAMAAARVELEKDWGGKDSATYRFNLLQAKEGAARLGLDPAAVDTLENLMGYPKVMNALRKIGNARREDVFVENDVPGSGRVTTREGALSRKQELFADAAWVKRFNAGDVEAKTEWKKLNMMIEGDA